MENNESYNDSQEEVVEPQETEEVKQTTDDSESTGEKEVETAEQPSKQSEEQNKAFAELRRQAEGGKKANDIIAKLYPEPVQIGDKTFVIKNVYDLEKAQAYQEEVSQQQKYESMGIDKNTLDEAINSNPAIQKANEILQQQEKEKAFNTSADELFKAFPDLKPTDVPKEVLEAYEQGIPMLTGYKCYKYDNMKTSSEQEAIKQIRQNGQKDTGSLSSGEPQNFYTEDQVDKMSTESVKQNYTAIMKSMKQWKK